MVRGPESQKANEPTSRDVQDEREKERNSLEKEERGTDDESPARS